MRRLAAGSWGLAAVLAAATVSAQTLDARIHAAAAPGGVTWVGYRVPKVPRGGEMCGPERPARVALEPPTELRVLARIENGAVTRLRAVTPDCDIDTTGATLVWLSNVTPEESVTWLSSLVSQAASGTDAANHVTQPALGALALHAADAATTPLIGFARSHPVPRVRGQALFWLAQRAGDRSVATIADAIDRDPDTDVKKRAVFALSQLPKDEGVPKLIEVARTNRNPAVRKQAFFWLGQSKDPRAVRFFEEILLQQ